MYFVVVSAPTSSAVVLPAISQGGILYKYTHVSVCIYFKIFHTNSPLQYGSSIALGGQGVVLFIHTHTRTHVHALLRIHLISTAIAKLEEAAVRIFTYTHSHTRTHAHTPLYYGSIKVREGHGVVLHVQTHAHAHALMHSRICMHAHTPL